MNHNVMSATRVRVSFGMCEHEGDIFGQTADEIAVFLQAIEVCVQNK